MSGAPATVSAARSQHAAGDAHAWDACPGCGAARGEQCYSLARRRRLGPGDKRSSPRHKLVPCAGRVWHPREPDDLAPDPCPLCQSPVRAKWSGVECTSCDWWYCA